MIKFSKHGSALTDYQALLPIWTKIWLMISCPRFDPLCHWDNEETLLDIINFVNGLSLFWASGQQHLTIGVASATLRQFDERRLSSGLTKSTLVAALLFGHRSV